MSRLASIYPLVTARAVARPFTYEVPDDVGVGSVVEVRFGNARRRGLVVEVGVEAPPDVKIAPIERSSRSCRRRSSSSRSGSRTTTARRLRARSRSSRPCSESRAASASSPASATRSKARPRRRELSDSQREMVERIVGAIDAGAGGNFLLYGATGSGKTEVYLQACAAALERGLGAIVLVPEIALTPQAVGRFRQRFGEQVALLHSGLTEAERRDERARIASGEARIVVGARSAIFAPVRGLGLICVDEEHDQSYKQESDPRYDARTVAAKRASLEHAVAVFGSATPRPESWETLERLELGGRIAGKLPPVRVDRPAPRGRLSALGAAAAGARARSSRRGEKAILLLNRRGVAPALHCRDCGTTIRCENCDVALDAARRRHAALSPLRLGASRSPSSVPSASPPSSRASARARNASSASWRARSRRWRGSGWTETRSRRAASPTRCARSARRRARR